MKNNIFKNGKSSYGLMDAGIGEFVYLVLQYLIVVALYVAISLGLPSGNVVNEIASFLIEIGFLSTVLIVSAISRNSVFKATKLNVKPKTNQFWFTILIAVIAYFGFASLTNAFIDFLDLAGYSSTAGSINVDSWWKYILYVFSMAAVPAFCEELLFRGLIYQGLRKWSKVGAVFISAALFMLMHGSPDQTIHQFILGIVLALVFNATGSIWCPMLLHFLNNFIALTLSFVLTMASKDISVTEEVVGETVAQANPWYVWFVELYTAIAIGIVAGLIIWFIYKYLKKQQLAQSMAGQTIEQNADGNEQTEDSLKLVDSEDDEVKETTTGNGNRAALVLFILASIWVSFEWIERLISGFLK